MANDVVGMKRVAVALDRRAGPRLKATVSAVEKWLYLQGVLRPDPSLLPRFLGIGVRKSGTTWLYENFHAHPEVDAGVRKSHHYFDKNFHDPLRGYLRNFASDADDDLARGEVTTDYAFMPEQRIRFLRRVMPEVRLVLLLRNPVEREWSLVVHHAVKHGIPIEGLTDDLVIPFLEKSKTLRRGGYSGVIERWHSIFPPEQLFVGFYEDIAQRPRWLLTRVFEHIGVSSDVDWSRLPFDKVIVPPNGPQYQGHDPYRGAVAIGHTNSSRYLPDRYRRLLADMYREDIERLSHLLGGHATSWRGTGRGEDHVAAGTETGEHVAPVGG